MNTELLNLLEKDARLTPAQLGMMLGRDEQSVSDEIAEYERNHIILGYPALIDWTKTDDELVTALIEVRIAPQRGDGFDRMSDAGRISETQIVFRFQGLGKPDGDLAALMEREHFFFVVFCHFIPRFR